MRVTTKILFAVMFLFSCGVCAAPVPKHKPIKRPDLTEKKWAMRWGVSTFRRNQFGKDGGYSCDGKYVGRWKLEGDTLTIRWWAVPSMGVYPVDDVITLEPGKLSGHFGLAKHPFELVPDVLYTD